MVEAFIILVGVIVWGAVKGYSRWRDSLPAGSPAIVHAPTLAPVRKPGFVYVLWDKNRPDLVKIVGAVKPHVSPLDELYTLVSGNYQVELARVYDDLRESRVVNCWYDKGATEMYLDHRMGNA